MFFFIFCALWVLAGLIASGFINAYLRKGKEAASVLFIVIWSCTCGPLAFVFSIPLMSYGWTLNWRPIDYDTLYSRTREGLL